MTSLHIAIVSFTRWRYAHRVVSSLTLQAAGGGVPLGRSP